jgi:hypothetical protein
MTATEFETLRDELRALRHEMDVRFAKMESKLDDKPSIVALYQAVVVLMFGIGTVITSAVVVLKNIGLMP